MAKGSETNLIKKKETPPASKPQLKQEGNQSSIMIHIFLVIMMILNWAGILLELPKEYNYVTKPTVVLTMFFYTLYQSHNGAKAFKQFMAIGFLFSVFGDIFLMFEGKQFFMYGLVSFATAHVAFIIGFFENSSFDSNQFVNFSVPIGVLLVGYGFYIYSFLTSQNGFPDDLKFPVLVYLVLISTMCFASSMRDRTSNVSYYLGFIGAIFFVVSDSTLSFFMFVPGFSNKIVRLIVMVTYYIAEHLILIASLKHYNYYKNRDEKKNE